MPVPILVGILSVVVAFVLYTVGVWTMFRSKAVRPVHVVLLWLGVVFDITATVSMAIPIGGLASDLHTYIALTAMAGMFLAAVVAAWSLARSSESLGRAVTRWALAPWALWAFVFVWGMATRAPRA